MKVYEYIAKDINLFATMLVYPVEEKSKNFKWTLWRFIKINDSYEYTTTYSSKEEAIKAAKEYLNNLI